MKTTLTLPQRLSLAHLPTPIEKLSSLSDELGVGLYIKRDDYTGSEFSGNKIRKLEYAIAEAIDQGATVLITCGGLQSNHARATVAAARKLGLKAHLVLRGDEAAALEGNYMLNVIMGAEITFLRSEVFADTHEKEMASLKDAYEAAGERAYILPIGASNGIGNFGYFNAYEEILIQEKALGIHFDTIVCTVGSGGTYGGLYLGNLCHEGQKRIIGFNISATAAYFQHEIARIVNDSLDRLAITTRVLPEEMTLIDGYAGLGYAISQPEELDFILEISRQTGIIFDPVYTGKAFRGLMTELRAPEFGKLGPKAQLKNVLFIHTGGLMGFVPSYLGRP